jgi:hypothetical protein
MVVIAGLVLRGLVMRTGLAQANSDLGVIYLMALHSLHGDPTVFYWASIMGAASNRSPEARSSELSARATRRCKLSWSDRVPTEFGRVRETMEERVFAGVRRLATTAGYGR